MHRTKNSRLARRLGALALVLVAGRASAFDLASQAQVHAYGSQDYIQTTDDSYLGAGKTGTWSNNFLGIVSTIEITDKSKLWAQLEASGTDQTRFTWFFVDYQVSDAVRLHVGRVKMPIGLYNETIDTKFLQLSSIEPVIYQGDADFVHDSYNGAGLDYDTSLGQAGRLAIQSYVGQPYVPDEAPGVADRAVYGGRITYSTPVDGLRFLVSAARSKVQLGVSTKLVAEDRVIFSGDYVSNDWDVKSEYATHKFNGLDANAYYLQAGKTFAGLWTPFARYEVSNLDRARQGDDSYTEKTMVVGLGYKLLAGMVLRAEAHFNRGYALPVASGEVAAGAGVRDWTMMVVGVHFIL